MMYKKISNDFCYSSALLASVSYLHFFCHFAFTGNILSVSLMVLVYLAWDRFGTELRPPIHLCAIKCD